MKFGYALIRTACRNRRNLRSKTKPWGGLSLILVVGGTLVEPCIPVAS